MKIDDQISKILTHASIETGGKMMGSISTLGKAVDNPDDMTFKQLQTKNNQLFSVTYSDGVSGAEPKRWIRFKNFGLRDYYYLSTYYWDAVAFVPKRDVIFFGFGIMSNYRDKDVKHVLQWQLGEGGNDYSSEEFEVEFANEDADQEKKWWSFDIRSVGEKPIKVPEGQQIHVKMKTTRDDE